MKAAFNIIGNIGSKKPLNSTSTTEENIPRLALSIATNKNYKNKKGEWEKKTYWNDIILFGPLARRVNEHYTVGTLLLVEGTVCKNQFVNKEGEKHTPHGISFL